MKKIFHREYGRPCREIFFVKSLALWSFWCEFNDFSMNSLMRWRNFLKYFSKMTLICMIWHNGWFFEFFDSYFLKKVADIFWKNFGHYFWKKVAIIFWKKFRPLFFEKSWPIVSIFLIFLENFWLGYEA